MEVFTMAASGGGVKAAIMPVIARLATILAGALLLFSLAGCYGPPLSPRETGTLAGGALGAGGGALLGSAVGAPGTGAILGGVGGGLAGYLIGNQMQYRDYYRYRYY
jgi:hypothetical protein